MTWLYNKQNFEIIYLETGATISQRKSYNFAPYKGYEAMIEYAGPRTSNEEDQVTSCLFLGTVTEAIQQLDKLAQQLQAIPMVAVGTPKPVDDIREEAKDAIDIPF